MRINGGAAQDGPRTRISAATDRVREDGGERAAGESKRRHGGRG